MLLEELKDTKPVLKYSADGTLLGTPHPPLVQVALHKVGCKLLYRLLAPQRQHLEPDEEPLFVTSEKQSRKAASAKRSEHLAYLKAPLIFVATRYAHELLRSRSGARVLRLIAEVFYPRTLVEAVVGAFAGLAVDVPEPVDAAADDDDEDSEEEDDEENETQMKTSGGKGDGGDDDDDDEKAPSANGSDWGNDDDIEDDEEEASAAATKLPRSGTAAAGSAKPPVPPPASTVPLHEDAVAHQALKQLLQFELAAETPGSGASGGDSVATDSAMWEGGDRAQLAVPLLKALQSAGVLQDWLRCNRGCFALHNMLQVPSARTAILAALKGQEAALRGAAGDLPGAKTLLAEIDSTQAKGGKKVAGKK